MAGLLDPTDLTPDATPAGLTPTCAPYQETGFRLACVPVAHRLGGILADEMGLGKTLQALAAAQAAHEAAASWTPADPRRRPDLGDRHLGGGAARFAPDLTVAVVPGTRATRRGELADFVAGAQIVVTSYTLLRLEAEAYQDLDWSMVLLDEAQFVKNHASKAYHAVRKR